MKSSILIFQDIITKVHIAVFLSRVVLLTYGIPGGFPIIAFSEVLMYEFFASYSLATELSLTRHNSPHYLGRK